MIIPPNENGWSYDDSTGNWKLVYADKIIIFYEETNVSIATQSTLFVGTHEECDEQIVKEGLPFPVEVEITDQSTSFVESQITEEGLSLSFESEITA
jgi:hypothetical protein